MMLKSQARREVLQGLGLLACAREPLTLRMLRQFFGRQTAERMEDLLTVAADFFSSHSANRAPDTPFHFFHSQLPEFILGQAADHYADLHAQLADACLRWRDLDGDAHRYALRYLLTHMREAQRWDRLCDVLLDFTYLQARITLSDAKPLDASYFSSRLYAALTWSSPSVTVGDAVRIARLPMPIFDILQDFHNTLAILPPDHPEMVAVTALSRAIDAGSHILKADPTLFIQQMRNELVWSWGEETKLGQALRSAAGRYKRTWLKRLTPSRVTTDSAFLRALSGHRGRVWSVAFAPDGQTLASGGVDRTVRLWDTQTGAERLTLEGHHGRIASVAFAPDSQMVASGSEDGTVRLWDVQKGEEKRVIEGHCGRIWSVAFAPDGQMVVSGSEDGTVRLWDTHTGTERQVLQGHRRGVSSVAFAPDGQIVASGSEDGT